jgi:hypothetical protein
MLPIQSRHWFTTAVLRVPVLSGTSVSVVQLPDDATVLLPPTPGEAIANVEAAVRDALRFPLAGEGLDGLATRGGRATIVVEPTALPIPGGLADPRREALAAAVDELERVGIPPERQTVLVAGGLARRAGKAELEALVSPVLARTFRGRVLVHDIESPDLVDVGSAGRTPLRVHPALVETDLVLPLGSAESVIHGGPSTLVAATCPETLRAVNAYSLLEWSASSGWRVALALERALAERTALIGVSLVLNHPRFAGPVLGYPYEREALERVARSPLQRLYRTMPSRVRRIVLQSLRAELTAATVLAGPPSVAHAEALLRGIELRSAELERPLDTICIGIPRATPYLPRERPNPLLAAYLGLGLALRLWRTAFPLVDGGTAILVHPFWRYFSHPTQQPYRAFFAGATRLGREPEALAVAERAVAQDRRAIADYRAGETCHPLLPFADWEACTPALERLGAVLVAGCRDASAARGLGFVPVHSVAAALELAKGRAGPGSRVGVLVSPPYFPLRVQQSG